MAHPYEVDGDNLYSDSEEYDDDPGYPTSPPPVAQELESETVPVVRRFASNFPSFRMQPDSGDYPVNVARSSLARPTNESNLPAGPRIHPDRLANFARNRPAANHEPRRNHNGSWARSEEPVRAPAEHVRAPSKPIAASILPDDDLKEAVLAATAKRKGAEAAMRKRPGARKRRLESESTPMLVLKKEKVEPGAVPVIVKRDAREVLHSERPSKHAQVGASKHAQVGALGHFGDLRSLAAGSLVVPGARKSEDTAHQSRPAPQDVYRDATLTKKMLEREAQREAEELARIDEEVALQRQAERQERRLRAQQMRQHRTVAAGMRDCYELERVENYLFGSESGTGGSLAENLGLKLKCVGTDPMTEELWTIVIEVI